MSWQKIVFLILFAGSFTAAKSQAFDTLRIRGALLSAPFDPSPRYIDSLVLALNDGSRGPISVISKAVIPEIILKYAEIMRADPEGLKNEKIYEFIDSWMGTPYRYGGTGRRGIDCSALTQALFHFACEIILPRTSREMYTCSQVEIFKGNDFSMLQEGDLLFFRSKGRINHVAVYLCNGKFLSANRRGGVQIDELNNPYWRKRYDSAGRLKTALPDGA